MSTGWHYNFRPRKWNTTIYASKHWQATRYGEKFLAKLFITPLGKKWSKGQSQNTWICLKSDHDTCTCIAIFRKSLQDRAILINGYRFQYGDAIVRFHWNLQGCCNLGYSKKLVPNSNRLKYLSSVTPISVAISYHIVQITVVSMRQISKRSVHEIWANAS